MENKKTTELLDLLHSLVDEKGNLQEGYEEALEELKSREPFFTILNEEMEESIPWLVAEIESLKEDIKQLKRHKHDKTGDVLIRI